MVLPPNGDWGLMREPVLGRSRPLPDSGEGRSGCQLPGCLVGVCVRVSVSALMGRMGMRLLQSWALS